MLRLSWPSTIRYPLELVFSDVIAVEHAWRGLRPPAGWRLSARQMDKQVIVIAPWALAWLYRYLPRHVGYRSLKSIRADPHPASAFRVWFGATNWGIGWMSRAQSPDRWPRLFIRWSWWRWNGRWVLPKERLV